MYRELLQENLIGGDLSIIDKAARSVDWIDGGDAWQRAGAVLQTIIANCRRDGERIPEEVRLSLVGLGMTADFAAAVRAIGASSG
jgi:hypothetical protein